MVVVTVSRSPHDSIVLQAPVLCLVTPCEGNRRYHTKLLVGSDAGRLIVGTDARTRHAHPGLMGGYSYYLL